MAERPSTELRLELIEARLRAHEVALQWLFKAIASIDPAAGQAVLLALEVLELEQLELTGKEDETLRCLSGDAATPRTAMTSRRLIRSPRRRGRGTWVQDQSQAYGPVSG